MELVLGMTSFCTNVYLRNPCFFNQSHFQYIFVGEENNIGLIVFKITFQLRVGL